VKSYRVEVTHGKNYFFGVKIFPMRIIKPRNDFKKLKSQKKCAILVEYSCG
jgi:hypothetical protein